MRKIDNTIRTSIEPELKKLAQIQDVCFAEAMRIGVRVILKRREGLAGLMNEEKKILKQIELLHCKLDVIKAEIKKFKEHKKAEKTKEEKEKKKQKEKEVMRKYDAIRMNNPLRRPR